MGIRQRFEHGKALLNQGADLLLLRLQVLSLDLTSSGGECRSGLAIWLVLSGALLMVGLVGLLFGLNRVSVGCGRFVGVFRHFLREPADYCRIVPQSIGRLSGAGQPCG